MCVHVWYTDTIPASRVVARNWCVLCSEERDLGAEKYVAAYGLSRAQVRTLLYNRQDGVCLLCGDDLPQGYLHSQHVNIDHTRPRSHGGPDVLDNLTLAHRPCNGLKADTCAGCDYCLPGAEGMD